jgi:regulator of protease activity HflC (stomatin/prohibitin superfamily)
MVGNAVVLFAIATGIIFRFFDNDNVILGIAYAIPIFMLLSALETVLNLVLNFYRPRIPGEVPRVAFDSRVLGMLAAPDSLVRSINEAVNYQFGFDVTSTWGYKLLMRSVVRLAALGLLVMLLLSMIVVIEPHQQAVKLSSGRVVGDRVYESGVMWKLPWPLQSASVHDVWRIRELPLTARRRHREDVNVWTRSLDGRTDEKMQPFLVGRWRLREAAAETAGMPAAGLAGTPAADADDPEEAVSAVFGLVDAEITLQYRIQEAGGGLLDYMRFAPDTVARRERLSMRQKALRAIAVREVSLRISAMTLDEVLTTRRAEIAHSLQDAVQAAFDRAATGVEVISVNLPLLRPAGEAVNKFEDLAMAIHDQQMIVAEAESATLTTLTYRVGSEEAAAQVIERIDRLRALRSELGPDHPDAIELRAEIERLLRESGGTAGQLIAQAETDRWVELMSSRAQVSRTQRELAIFRAAPRLYRQRELMRLLAQLGEKRKYVIGIDPSRLKVDVELQELSPVLGLSLSRDEGAGTP